MKFILCILFLSFPAMRIQGEFMLKNITVKSKFYKETDNNSFKTLCTTPDVHKAYSNFVPKRIITDNVVHILYNEGLFPFNNIKFIIENVNNEDQLTTIFNNIDDYNYSLAYSTSSYRTKSSFDVYEPSTSQDTTWPHMATFNSNDNIVESTPNSVSTDKSDPILLSSVAPLYEEFSLNSQQINKNNFTHTNNINHNMSNDINNVKNDFFNGPSNKTNLSEHSNENVENNNITVTTNKRPQFNNFTIDMPPFLLKLIPPHNLQAGDTNSFYLSLP